MISLQLSVFVLRAEVLMVIRTYNVEYSVSLLNSLAEFLSH